MDQGKFKWLICYVEQKFDHKLAQTVLKDALKHHIENLCERQTQSCKGSNILYNEQIAQELQIACRLYNEITQATTETLNLFNESVRLNKVY